MSERNQTMKIIYAYAFIAVFIGAVVFPAFQDPPKDSFPLSTYPMFSGSKPRVTLNEVLGEDARGKDYILEPELIAESGEPMQVIATLRRVIEGGWRMRSDFCKAVASRIAADPAFEHIERVRLVTRTRDPVAFYEGRESGNQEKTWRRCSVRKGP